jgi:4-carboxymuconolactone decarboxylase
MDHGLTRAEISEVVTHLAFYAGWPYVFSAIPIVKSMFDGRPHEHIARSVVEASGVTPSSGHASCS